MTDFEKYQQDEYNSIKQEEATKRYLLEQLGLLLIKSINSISVKTINICGETFTKRSTAKHRSPFLCPYL